MTSARPAPLRSVLVANRGEIALRVMRTAARMGLRTIAIHTDLDAAAMHVRAADAAVRVPSYLDVDAVVAAAVATGADAVHPGYGFLSERAAFARALEAAGVTLVGPSAQVMEQMGRKDAAREIALTAGVPVVPRGEDAGYPVLVKAAAGGGGKGMRVVRHESDLAEATAAARREALAAFGDDTMLLERYVERGRHVEVQVFGDAHGGVVHLGERDCSAQRRHQKVLEEAPAPTLDDGTRTQMHAAAVALARHVGYTGAGTVEFLLDVESGEFFFLEMNTRLQVEHPVTEATVRIDGQELDLVELQLRVAAGEPLPFAQDDVRPVGHAIEARVYAEDAFGGFLPQAGRAELVRWPAGVRVDHALETGQVVSTAFDPMLGKVVVHAPDRESARAAMLRALDGTVVLGLTTNVGFLRELVASEAFGEAEIDTAWLDRNELPAPDPSPARRLAARALLRRRQAPSGSPFAADGFRLGGPPAPVVVRLDEDVVLDGPGPPPSPDAPETPVLVNAAGSGDRVELARHGQRFVFAQPDAFGAAAVAVGGGVVTSPMPGTVVEVRVAAGDAVAEGDVLGVVEAMKMELALRAPMAGAVVSVRAERGARVALGDELFEVEPSSDE